MVVFVMAGCKIPLSVDMNVETTSELGPNTLERIDNINNTIATGLEIGPETRGVIRELNQTIKDGIKTG